MLSEHLDAVAYWKRLIQSRHFGILALVIPLWGGAQPVAPPPLEPLFREAVSRKEANFGPNSPEVAKGLTELGAFLAHEEQGQQAVAPLERALRIFRSPKTKQPRTEALAAATLAQCLDDPARQTLLASKAYSLYTLVGDAAQAFPLALTLSDLADVRDSSEALEWAQRALHTGVTAFGENDPRLIPALNRLGLLQPDVKKAEGYLRKALQLSRVHYGADHPETATGMINFAQKRAEQGSTDEAVVLLQKAIRALEGTIGDGHVRIAVAHNHLGRLFFEQGFFREAADQHRRAAAVDASVLGAHHPQTGADWASAGRAEAALENWPAAEDALTRALFVYEKAGEPGNSGLLLLERAEIRSRRGASAIALGDLRLAIKRLEQAGVPGSQDLARALASLAWSQQQMGNRTAAKANYARALRVLDQAGLSDSQIAHQIQEQIAEGR